MRDENNEMSVSGCSSGTCGNPGHRNEEERQFPKGENLRQRMSRIKHKILVLSGKGGVGKSTVAVNLAVALALAGKRVGVLDVDIHGPSIPKLLHLDTKKLDVTDAGIIPTRFGDNLKVMSIGFLLREDSDPVIWRGPMKYGVIKQFLEDVVWGDLDFLVVDSPPGTGDEPLSVAQILMQEGGGVSAVIVTTPQELALTDVRKSINFCRQLSMSIMGVVENMSGFICPHCGKVSDIFKTGGGAHMAEEMRVRFLGSLPIDPQIVQASDAGEPYMYHYARTETAKAFGSVIKPILDMDISMQMSSHGAIVEEIVPKKEGEQMRIAIPIAGGRMAMHFGHCAEFALLDVDPVGKKILRKDSVKAPDHQPGLLPVWLKERGVDVVIAGGMGSRAQDLFVQHGIKVVTGASAEEPQKLVEAFLLDTLKTEKNVCDH